MSPFGTLNVVHAANTLPGALQWSVQGLPSVSGHRALYSPEPALPMPPQLPEWHSPMRQTFVGRTHWSPFVPVEFVGTVSWHVRAPPPASTHVPLWHAFVSSRHAVLIAIQVQSGLQQPLPSALGWHCGLPQSAFALRGMKVTIEMKMLTMNGTRRAERTRLRSVMITLLGTRPRIMRGVNDGWIARARALVNMTCTVDVKGFFQICAKLTHTKCLFLICAKLTQYNCAVARNFLDREPDGVVGGAHMTRGRAQTLGRVAGLVVLISGLAGVGRATFPQRAALADVERADPAGLAGGAAYGAPPSGLLARYVADPDAVCRELVAAGRESRATWPTPALLLLADAHVRGGQVGAARRVFAQVLAQTSDPEAAGWAHLGLGWSAMLRGDFSEARPQYALVAAGMWAPDVAAVMLGLVDAAEGRALRAVSTLERIADAPETAYQLRGFARLAAAYARYWAGDFPGAAVAFDDAASAQPFGPLVDDARYGLAWSLLRSGDRSSAIDALRAVATDGAAGINPPRVPMSLLNLELRSMLRASMTRYRRVPVGQPRELLVALLDGDGSALARAALVHLGEEPLPVSTPRNDGVAAADVATNETIVEGPAAHDRVAEHARSRQPAPALPSRSSQPRRGWDLFLWLSVAGAAVVLALAVWWAASRREVRVPQSASRRFPPYSA